MDQTGRRRRFVTALGAAVGVLVMAGGGLLIAGLLGSSPVPLPGLPDKGQGVLQHGVAGDSGEELRPAPTGTTSRTRPPATPTATSGAQTNAAPTDKPGQRRTSHPGNPKPTRTK